MHEKDTSGEVNAGVLSRPILVPLDGTDAAQGILPYVSQLARGADVPLVLHGVVDPGAIAYPASIDLHDPSPSPDRGVHSPIISDSAPKPSRPEVAYRDQIEAGSLAYAEGILKKIARGLRDDGVNTEVVTSMGNSAAEILRVAEEEGCGLIAMSTHGRIPIARSILGSVTDKVIHSSILPVLTVKPEKAKKYQRREGGASLTTVMVPLDGAKFAERALPYVEELASSLSLELLLVRVVDLEYPVYTYGEYAGLGMFAERLVEEATTYLDGVAQSFRNKGLVVRSHVIRGSPAHVLVSLAQETPHDLVAMTTHGRSGMSRWQMGSVAEAMIRASGDPVLVVRPQA